MPIWLFISMRSYCVTRMTAVVHFQEVVTDNAILSLVAKYIGHMQMCPIPMFILIHVYIYMYAILYYKLHNIFKLTGYSLNTIQ